VRTPCLARKRKISTTAVEQLRSASEEAQLVLVLRGVVVVLSGDERSQPKKPVI